MADSRWGSGRRKALRRPETENRTHDWQVWGVRFLCWIAWQGVRALLERVREQGPFWPFV